jgi:two-component system sporulation sensor kinase A
MLSELDRINSIAGEFLFLSKPQVSQFSTKDLISVLKNVVTLLHSQALLQNVQINIESNRDSLDITCALIINVHVFILSGLSV